jgi:hypothetical protein
MKYALVLLPTAAALALLMVPVASFVYESGGGPACARCHEIGPAYERWNTSSHRNVACTSCHGDAWTTDVNFHLTNLHRVKAHTLGEVPEKPRLIGRDALAMQARCQKCHPNEFAAWRNGPHSVTYSSIFLDTKHNAERHLMDDCLRCHGMHYEGDLRSLVAPLNRQGPWQLLRGDLAAQPAIPCLACHSVHRHGEPLKGHTRKANVASKEEILRPSLALFDRRAMEPMSVKDLPLPVMHEGARPVRMSPDSRQALCYQCHAPLATSQVWSGDDRTPVGVHEGLSCLACHDKHRQTTRASCSSCHPRLSNCGLDVEKMDTTFLKPSSAHNIHTVKCADCHPKGVPAKKPAPPARAG